MAGLICSLLVLVWLPPQGEDIRLVISKSEFRLSVLQGDSVLTWFPVAVGKNAGNKRRRGDFRTPEGQFRISQIQRATSWVHDFGDGRGPIEGAYGPWFIRMETPPWTGIGIHGTHDPSSIGTNATEGCIRMLNADVEALRKIVQVGFVVAILP